MEGPIPSFPLSLIQCDFTGNDHLCQAEVKTSGYVCDYKSLPSCNVSAQWKATARSTTSLVSVGNSNPLYSAGSFDAAELALTTFNSEVTRLATQISVEAKFELWNFLFMRLC